MNNAETPDFSESMHDNFIFTKNTPSSNYILASPGPKKEKESGRRIIPNEISPLSVSKSIHFDSPNNKDILRVDVPKSGLKITTSKYNVYTPKKIELKYKRYNLRN